jgi:hypothetical protein
VATLATRRRKSEDDASRGYVIILEEMRGHFKVFGEQLGAVGDRVTSLEGKFTSLEGKVTALDDRVTALDHKVDHGFARVEHRLGLVELAITEHTRELKKKVDRDEVEAIVDRAVARALPR